MRREQSGNLFWQKQRVSGLRIFLPVVELMKQLEGPSCVGVGVCKCFIVPIISNPSQNNELE